MWVQWSASCSPVHSLSPPPLFQGENLLYCFEVAPTQPALTQGKQVLPHPYLPRGAHCCLAMHPTVTLPVPQSPSAGQRAARGAWQLCHAWPWM